MFTFKPNARITIERKTTTQETSYGTDVVTWAALVARIEANIQDSLPSKSEAMSNGIRINTQGSRVRIRYRADIDATMRVIVHGATDWTYQIVAGPAEIGRREGLEFMVEEYSS